MIDMDLISVVESIYLVLYFKDKEIINIYKYQLMYLDLEIEIDDGYGLVLSYG